MKAVGPFPRCICTLDKQRGSVKSSLLLLDVISLQLPLPVLILLLLSSHILFVFAPVNNPSKRICLCLLKKENV